MNRKRSSLIKLPELKNMKKIGFVGFDSTKQIDINFANNTRNLDDIFARENKKKIKRFFTRSKFQLYEEKEVLSFVEKKKENEILQAGSYDPKRIISSCTNKIEDILKDLTKSDYFTPIHRLVEPKDIIKEVDKSHEECSEEVNKSSKFMESNNVSQRLSTEENSFKGRHPMFKNSAKNMRGLKINVHPIDIVNKNLDSQKNIVSSDRHLTLSSTKQRRSFVFNFGSSKDKLDKVMDKITKEKTLKSRNDITCIDNIEESNIENEFGENGAELIDKFNSIRRLKELRPIKVKNSKDKKYF